MALNLHNDFFVSHGQDLQPAKNFWDPAHAALRQRIFDNRTAFDWNNVDGYFDILESQKNHSVYANIHGIMTLEPFTNPTKFKRRYRVASMVRHPIPRVISFVNKWTERGATKRAKIFSESAPELMNETCRRYGVDQNDPTTILFIHAVKTAFFFDSLYITAGVPIIVTERLVTDMDYFSEWIFHLTAGSVCATKDYIDRVSRASPLDQMNKSQSPTDVFSAWPEWQQRHFRDQLTADLQQKYLSLGYNF